MLVVDAKRLPLASKASTLSPSGLMIGPAAINPDKDIDADAVGVAVVDDELALPPDEPPLLPARANPPSPAPKPNKLNDGVDATAGIVAVLTIDAWATIVSAWLSKAVFESLALSCGSFMDKLAIRTLLEAGVTLSTPTAAPSLLVGNRLLLETSVDALLLATF